MINTLVEVGNDLAIDVPVDLVQAWVADPSSNNGLALIVSATDFYCEVASSEATEELDRPILQVEIQ